MKYGVLKKKLLNLIRREPFNCDKKEILMERSKEDLTRLIVSLYSTIKKQYKARIGDLQEAVIIENKLNYIDKNHRVTQIRIVADRIMRTPIDNETKLKLIMKEIYYTDSRRKKRK